MAAANTDLFKKAGTDWTGAVGAGGVADASVTTVPLVSSTGLPTDTAIQITIDRIDASGTETPSKKEVITGVVSGDNVISCIRGVEGTAQAHSAGAVVEIMLTAAMWNDEIDGFLEEHNQDGTHNEFKAWSNWSAIWTNLTVGNGSVDSKYIQIGKTVHFRLRLVFGTTTSISGGVSVSLPVNNIVATGVEEPSVGTVLCRDTSATASFGGVLRVDDASKVLISYFVVSGVNILISSITATAPFTWDTGDVLSINGTYEAV